MTAKQIVKVRSIATRETCGGCNVAARFREHNVEVSAFERVARIAQGRQLVRRVAVRFEKTLGQTIERIECEIRRHAVFGADAG